MAFLDSKTIKAMLDANGFHQVRVTVKWATLGPNEISFDFSQHPTLATHDFIKGVVATLRTVGHTVLLY